MIRKLVQCSMSITMIDFEQFTNYKNNFNFRSNKNSNKHTKKAILQGI